MYDEKWSIDELEVKDKLNLLYDIAEYDNNDELLVCHEVLQDLYYAYENLLVNYLQK